MWRGRYTVSTRPGLMDRQTDRQAGAPLYPRARATRPTPAEPMVWRYDIKATGEAEQPQQGSTFKFKCKARSQVRGCCSSAVRVPWPVAGAPYCARAPALGL